MNRLILPENLVNQLANHLEKSLPNEEGAFFTIRHSETVSGSRIVADKLLLPEPGDWEIQKPYQLRPSGQWLSAMISHATESKTGLLFVHSHPSKLHPYGFSPTDLSSIYALGDTIAPMLDGPFMAAVVHKGQWAAATWSSSGLKDVDVIASIGLGMHYLGVPTETDVTDMDTRQKDALGSLHEIVRNLSITLVGCGGLGSPVAEQLVRMGIKKLTLVDNDLLDTASNVRRVFGSTMYDITAQPPFTKVDIVGRHIQNLGFDTEVIRLSADIRAKQILPQLLDSDVVIGTTDTHGSRAILNDISHAYLLPYIDAGVRIGSKECELMGLLAEVRHIGPGRPCLWCSNVINPDIIREENMPEEEREKLGREGYLVGSWGVGAPSVVALTTMGSGLITCGLLALLSSEASVLPSAYFVDGVLGDAMELPYKINEKCRCLAVAKRANEAPIPLL